MKASLLVGYGMATLASLAPAASPGDIDVSYGDDGWVEIEAVTSNVGVGPLRADPAGRTVLTFTADPESGGAVLVSADGSAVSAIDLGGPGKAAFGPDGRLYAGFDEGGSVIVARFDFEGVLDPSFGSGGTVAVGTEGLAVTGDIVVGDEGVVVVGGILGPDRLEAWAARFDLGGQVDSNFGDGGVTTLAMSEQGEADLVLATDVHLTFDGYLAVVLTRSLAGDAVSVVAFDSEGTPLGSADLAYPDEIRSTASVLLTDGSVLLAVQTHHPSDVDSFHLTKYAPDGTPDAGFGDPDLTDDEVGGPVHVVQLRTGPIAIAYNRGPDPSFVVRLVGLDGEDLGSMGVAVDTLWMYGMTAVNQDGGLIFAVDETPVASIEPDDLTLVKIKSDDSGRFLDDDGSTHEADIEELAGLGITRGCNPPANTRFCPADHVTRGQLAAFLVRALGLAPSEVDAFVDDESSIFEDDINRLAASGITRGCNPPANTRFCPDDDVTRGQLAAFLVRALGLAPSETDAFVDDESSIFEDDINRLAASGITRGCNPPTNTQFCPDDPVTRAQMASFLVLALTIP